MSVTPICAMTDPSTISIIECTTDSGWTTISISSGPKPNSQWASITSNPLFISVAESIVILDPMLHVGWRIASETVASFISADLRSEEHTSELQSLRHLVCRLLLEKKKKKKQEHFE